MNATFGKNCMVYGTQTNAIYSLKNASNLPDKLLPCRVAWQRIKNH